MALLGGSGKKLLPSPSPGLLGAAEGQMDHVVLEHRRGEIGQFLEFILGADPIAELPEVEIIGADGSGAIVADLEPLDAVGAMAVECVG